MHPTHEGKQIVLSKLRTKPSKHFRQILGFWGSQNWHPASVSQSLHFTVEAVGGIRTAEGSSYWLGGQLLKAPAAGKGVHSVVFEARAKLLLHWLQTVASSQ